MSVDRLYRLTCGVRHYDWGDPGVPGRAPFIADLLGVPADGRPYAELWVGAHPTLPATVSDWPGAPRLDTLLREQPDAFLGRPDAMGAALPFLLKILSCVRPLSIQAHPDRELAACLHARDPRHYPDANHKPEVAVALTPFEALAGFRGAEAIQADIGRVPALQRFFAGIPAGPEWLRQAYARIFTAAPRDTEMALCQADAAFAGHVDPGDQARVFRLCQGLHPGDPGVLSVLFLNLVRLEPGEAFFIPPNVPHAYLRGTIIECMAASDNVVRGGLTRRHVDSATLLSMLAYQPEAPAILRGTPAEPGVQRYGVPADEFELELRDIRSPGEVSSAGRISLLLILSGAVRLSTPGWDLVAPHGTALVWPAGVPILRFGAVSGPARWVRATPTPDHGPP